MRISRRATKRGKRSHSYRSIIDHGATFEVRTLNRHAFVCLRAEGTSGNQSDSTRYEYEVEFDLADVVEQALLAASSDTTAKALGRAASAYIREALRTPDLLGT